MFISCFKRSKVKKYLRACMGAFKGEELAQWQSTRPLIQRSPVLFRARSHTGVMDYDEACLMHITPGVVHNFLKAVGV